MEKWPHTEPDEIIKVGWRTLVRKHFAQPDGRSVEYVTKDSPDKVSVAIIALTPDSKVIIAEQFRPGPEEVMQELPGGGSEIGEDYEQAALRELTEETGYSSSRVQYLGKVYKDAYTNSQHHYYIAFDAVQSSSQELDDGEFITVRLITIDELFDNARNAKLTDTEAVFLAYEQLSVIKAKS